MLNNLETLRLARTALQHAKPHNSPEAQQRHADALDALDAGIAFILQHTRRCTVNTLHLAQHV